MEFGELGSGFVEVFVVEFGDSPLFFLHLGGAVVVEFLGGGTDIGDELEGWGLGEGEGFKAGVVSVASIALQRRTLNFYPRSMGI